MDVTDDMVGVGDMSPQPASKMTNKDRTRNLTLPDGAVPRVVLNRQTPSRNLLRSLLFKVEIRLLSVIIAPDYTCFHEGQVAQQSFEGSLLDSMEIKHLTTRRTLRRLINFLFRTLSKLEVIGLENIPPEGGYIIAVNHLSRLDPPLGFALVDRDDLTAIVTDKYKNNLLISPIVNFLNGIWIDRDIADFHAIREARKYLKAGWILGIAPEGTRSTIGALLPAKTGVAYLADKVNIPIIPAAIYGTENAIRQLFRLRRPHIHMHFGESFLLPKVERASRTEDLEQNTDEIMCQIAVMLPPSYRGPYADHPRLHELSGSQEFASLAT